MVIELNLVYEQKFVYS